MQKSLFPFIPFLLLIVPVLEIAVFIFVGGQIGVINTLLGIVLTAFIGTVLLRQQGFALIGQAQAQMERGNIPGKELAHGVMLLAAGLLLLTPGFVTDSIGFLLLVPPVRDTVFAFFKSRITLAGIQSGEQGRSAHFSSHGFGGKQGGFHGTYYESQTYSTGDHDRGPSSDPSIIDLDGPDNKDERSPWGKS